jgi:hypothetical protein
MPFHLVVAFSEKSLLESISSDRKPRLFLVSYHCSWDRSSGAALCTRDLLELLMQRPFGSRAGNKFLRGDYSLRSAFTPPVRAAGGGGGG